METRHLIITGRVQGVGFRYYMEYKARQFRITGWVRNRVDGSVEALIQGTPENIAALIKRAKHGPPKAAVTEVKVTPGSGADSGADSDAGSGTFTTFVTLPTS